MANKQPKKRRAKRPARRRPSRSAPAWDFSRASGSSPPISVTDALALASRRSGRSIAEAWSATYVSALELEAVLAENPTAAKSVRRFEPHWRILFAKREGFVDMGRGPAYTFMLESTDHVLVFADGTVLTHVEAQPPDGPRDR